MLWIEAQSTPVITLLVFGVCYMLAAAIFCSAAILSRRAVAQDLKAVVAIEHALEARRNRIRLSQAEIAPIQWIVIIVLAVLILITLAMIHIGNRLAMAITMFIFSTAIAVCLVLLTVYDRPFGAGGFVTRPTVLRDIMPE